jgi:putative transposase
VHAYVLMCNHVHLLATPQEAGGVGRMMQGVGRRYVGFFNLTMERTGTLWDGRFKSCLVDSESYALRCYRYIERNPVRAAIVDRPGDFRWSSYRSNGLGHPDPLVTPHPAYLALGASAQERNAAYRQIVAQCCEARDLDGIRAMTSRNRVFGSEAFRELLAAEHQRAMGTVRVGRPRRKAAETEPGL